MSKITTNSLLKSLVAWVTLFLLFPWMIGIILYIPAMATAVILGAKPMPIGGYAILTWRYVWSSWYSPLLPIFSIAVLFGIFWRLILPAKSRSNESVES